MKKVIKKHLPAICSVLVFYSIIVFGIIALNKRFEYLNKKSADVNYNRLLISTQENR